MKKVYVTPSVYTQEIELNTNILAGSMNGSGAGTEDLSFGSEDNEGIGGDVKGNSFEFEW